jgi:hypothetical protein
LQDSSDIAEWQLREELTVEIEQLNDFATVQSGSWHAGRFKSPDDPVTQ